MRGQCHFYMKDIVHHWINAQELTKRLHFETESTMDAYIVFSVVVGTYYTTRLV